MGQASKPRKRWMKSALKTSAQATPDLPFKRGQKGGTAARRLCPTPRLMHSA